MASTDAKPVPKKNEPYRHSFALRDNAGNLVTTWAGMDSKKSLDGASVTDCTNEATEIGASGMGYIDLTAAEMNTDCTLLKVTVTNTDALDYVIALFPVDDGDIPTNPTQIGGQAVSATAAIDMDNLAAAAVDRLLLLETTVISTFSVGGDRTNQTIDLAAGSPDDNAYVNCSILIVDSSNPLQVATGIINGYTASPDLTITIAGSLDDIFTIAAGDKVYIFAEKSLKPYWPSTVNRMMADARTSGGMSTIWADVHEVDEQSVVATAEVDFDDIAIIQALVAGLQDLSAAQVNTEVDTALSDIHLDHLLATAYDPASKPGAATALWNRLLENNGGLARFTAQVLGLAPAGGGGGGSNNVTSFNGDTVSVARLVAILLAAGSSDTALAGNMVSTTLTAEQVAAIVNGKTIALQRGSKQTFPITTNIDMTGVTRFWWVGLKKGGDTIGNEMVKVDNTGLLIINKAAPGLATNGSITLTDAPTGTFTIELEAVEMAKLPQISSGVNAIQYDHPTLGIQETARGLFTVDLDVVQETS